MLCLEGLVTKRLAVPRGAHLYRFGEPFVALYAIRTGFFKTRTSSEDGREHVTGFQMAGELLGLDGLSSEQHTCDAVALEDSQVCAIPYRRLEDLSRDIPELQRQFHKILGREIVRDHAVMMLLSSMRAEERLAAFLLNLSQRLEARGFSATSLLLRMTREEIGTYLGLKLETISRCFSKFHEDGILSVRHRNIQILDTGALERLVGATPIWRRRTTDAPVSFSSDAEAFE
jgi:CRP/FNR family transcriptional regulator